MKPTTWSVNKESKEKQPAFKYCKDCYFHQNKLPYQAEDQCIHPNNFDQIDPVTGNPLHKTKSALECRMAKDSHYIVEGNKLLINYYYCGMNATWFEPKEVLLINSEPTIKRTFNQKLSDL